MLSGGIALALSLGGCGGGGSPDGKTAVPQESSPVIVAPAPTPVPAPTPTPSPAPQPAGYSAPFAQPTANIASVPDCPAPPEAVVRLSLPSMYVAGDNSFSQIDATKQAEREAILKPIHGFTYGVSRYANKYVASGGADVKSGACALAWLDNWARAGAMQQMVDNETQFIRSVQLSAWAIAYAQVKNLKVQSNAPDPAIRAWLTGLANDMRSHADSLTGNTVRNNHRYWAGLAAVAVAMDVGNEGLTRWGVESARIGISQIGPDGSLPLELARKTRAAHYHLYAAAPLVMTAAIVKNTGVDLYADDGGALHRLVKFATDNVVSTDKIAAMTGTPQDMFDLDTALGQQYVAWFEFYIRAFPGRASAQAAIAKERPLVNNELGGDLTMLAASGG